MADRKPCGRPKGTPKTGGRQRGTPNKATVEAKQACAEIVDDPQYRARLVERARAGALAPAVETMLWHYAKGRPREIIEHHQARDVAAMSDGELESALRASMEKLGYRVIPAASKIDAK